MPFIESGDKGRAEKCQTCPAPGPRVTVQRESGFPSAIEKNAQDSITEDVAGLAHDVMPEIEFVDIDMSEEEGEDYVKDVSSVGGRKQVGRLDGDERQPQTCGEPDFPQFRARASQWMAPGYSTA